MANFTLSRLLETALRLSLILVLTAIAGIIVYFGFQAKKQAKKTADYVAQLDGPDGFHHFYYDENIWQKTKWLGVPVLKLPLDLFTYQELLYDTQPDVVIEAGTLHGGSAYYFASLMDLLGNGEIITIDITELPNRPQHPRITYLLGSSTSDEILSQVKSMIPEGAKVMVVLDSDHSRDHVYNELRLYHELVTPGQYLVVEDSNINGHPVYPEFGPGPMEALESFLAENTDFEVDRSREKFLVTFNPNGYLRKK
jgi:cephalosporin hydroxylase